MTYLNYPSLTYLPLLQDPDSELVRLEVKVDHFFLLYCFCPFR